MSTWPGDSDDDEFDPRSLGAPWGDRTSIFDHIQRAIDPSTDALKPRHVELPDDEPVTEGGVKFCAGLLDGLLRPSQGEASAEVAKIVFAHMTRCVVERDPRALNILYAYANEHAALSYVDSFNPMLAEVVDSHGAEIALLGRHLLHHAADREVVKFAINLVGVCGGVEDHASLLTIGAHDEFTLFSVVALAHAGGDVESTWEMAKRSRGWGRIQCVERLDQDGLDSEIKRWLLTDGCRNAIMPEYSAAVCARRGDLLQALSDPRIDDRTIDGAAEILAALARGQPGEGMSGFDDGALATERFLAIVAEHEAPRVDWLLATRDIETFVKNDDDDASVAWDVAFREICAQAATRIRTRLVWRDVIASRLQSKDWLKFNLAASAAEYIGIDPWEHRFERLLSGGDQWYWLLETRDETRLERVLDFACNHVDLTKIATGYGSELGLGPGFEEHRKLDWILQALRRWPGRGAPFIHAGLKSPGIRNRGGAIRAALRWPVEDRHIFSESIEYLDRIEKDQRHKKELTRFLAGEVELESDF